MSRKKKAAAVFCFLLFLLLAWENFRILICKLTQYQLCVAISDEAWIVEEIPQHPESVAKMYKRKLR